MRNNIGVHHRASNIQHSIPSSGMDVSGWWRQELIFPKSSSEHASAPCQAKWGALSEWRISHSNRKTAQKQREKQQEHRSFAVWGQRFMWLSLIVKLFHCFHTRPGARNWRIKFPAPQNFHGEFICEARSRGQKETWLNGVMKGRWWKRLVYRC